MDAEKPDRKEGREPQVTQKKKVVDAEMAGGAQGEAGLLSGRVRLFPAGQQLESECEDTVWSTPTAACVHSNSVDYAIICLRMSFLP